MRSLFFLFILLLLGLSYQSQASSDSYKVGKKPHWVKDVPFKKDGIKNKKDQEGGWHHLLFNRQIRVQKSGRMENYFRIVTKVTSTEGLSKAAHVSINFAPESESLTLHHITITKNGEKKSALETVKPQLLRQETDLKFGIYDGRLTVNFDLQGVSVGDTIEYSYSLKETSSVMKGHSSFSFHTQWALPVKTLDISILWPHKKKIYLKNIKTKNSPVIKRQGAYKIYQWRQKDVKALIADKNRPAWDLAYPMVQVSSFKSWQDVVALFKPYFKKTVGPLFKAKLAEFESEPTLSGKLTAAVRFVQNDIRYLGIEIGDGGYVPRSVEETLKNRYGDCKDKSLLLSAFFMALGSEAYPALVHTKFGPALKTFHPSSFFNHAIVYTKFKGKSFWIDPTKSLQGGRFSTMHEPDYGYALILKNKTKSLTKMKNKKVETADFDRSTKEIYRISNFTSQASLLVTHTYKSYEADSLRRALANLSASKIKQNITEAYASTHPYIKMIGDLSVEDDFDKNTIVTTSLFEIPHFFHTSKDSDYLYANFSPYTVASVIRHPGHVKRNAPHALMHPVKRRHHMEIHLPDSISVVEEEIDVENKWYDFKQETSLSDDVLTIKSEYTSKKDAIRKENIRKYLKSYLNTTSEIGLRISYQKPEGYEEKMEEASREAAALAQEDGSSSDDRAKTARDKMFKESYRRGSYFSIAANKAADKALDLRYAFDLDATTQMGLFIGGFERSSGVYESEGSRIGALIRSYGGKNAHCRCLPYVSGALDFTSEDISSEYDASLGEVSHGTLSEANALLIGGFKWQRSRWFLKTGVGFEVNLARKLESAYEVKKTGSGLSFVGEFSVGVRL